MGSRLASLLIQQTTKAGDRSGAPGDAQRVPHHRGGGGHGGLAEVALHASKRSDRRHADAAQEHRLGLRHIDTSRKAVGALRGFLVDVLHVLQAPDADHLDAVRLEARLALRGSVGVVGRAESDSFYVQVRERGEHAAEGGDEGDAGLALHARDELRLALLAERVAGRGVREHDDLGRDHSEERDVLGEMRDLAAVSLLLTLVRTGGTVRDHAGEVHRYFGRCESNHLDLHRRVARRHEEADAHRSPARFHAARRRSYFSMPATLSMPALTQASSFSPPGAPEAPAAPMVSSPTLIGSAPWFAITLLRWIRPSCGLALSRSTISPDGMRKVREV